VFRELDNSKARRELGWTPRPLSQTIRDAVEWFDAREIFLSKQERFAAQSGRETGQSVESEEE
jgi:dTDP-D-glucose 4,6-dehydratase